MQVVSLQVIYLKFQALYPKFKHFSNLENTVKIQAFSRISSTRTNPADFFIHYPPIKHGHKCKGTSRGRGGGAVPLFGGAGIYKTSFSVL